MTETEEFRLENTFTKEQLKEAFFVETIEVRNETKKPIFITCIKSMFGNLFVHVWKDEGFEVKPNSYRLVPIEKEKVLEIKKEEGKTE
jgi:hypothetical protein